ncbi:hypothetical protein M0813_16272 [Anaeramoeba flamelloides]|uniref:histone acetyltransferase n=1 Tax=Anaeramoeba flamelloides TaxID=1746091 RepID=A0AAV8A0K6_9EUKA|nr:hypothetical protein M0812_07926 [Anaeramoeba flamelloides]KAJ6250217.1 hypothetical protein M0813_16272 [Anaeramoeba flamelloides]
MTTKETVSTESSEYVDVYNDGDTANLRLLINLRNVFSVQLPNMPREYIARIVFDKRHISIIARRNFEVHGGICFRPFPEQKIIEIVFCAVSSKFQGRGIGRRIMDHVKDYVQKREYYDILTYADNKAVGYFKKQGFSKEITIPDKRWKGYLKDYEGGVFMHCHLYKHVNYLDVRKMLQQQKIWLKQVCFKKWKKLPVYKGLDFTGREKIPLSQIDGLKQICNQEFYKKMTLKNELRTLFNYLTNLPDTSIFQEPVDAEDVPDYYTVIKNPMDFSKMKKKLENGEYIEKKLFIHDVQLIIDNCKKYNRKETVFYAYGENFERSFHEKLQSMEND